MAHDPTKVLLGASLSSFRTVDNRAGSIAAGLAVRLKSDKSISLLKSDGELLGVSFGGSLSNTPRTAIVRKGTEVPLLLTAEFVPVPGAQVFISDTTGMGIASGAGATGVNAIYKSANLTGVKEDGTTGSVALIDMPGGL